MPLEAEIAYGSEIAAEIVLLPTKPVATTLLKVAIPPTAFRFTVPESTASVEQKMLGKLTKQLKQDFVLMNQFNDPNGVYSYCLSCSIN